MALTVETGLIIPGAESYGSVEDCTGYHSNRGNAGWVGNDPAKEAALRKATAYLDNKYGNRWKGSRVSSTQPLMFPRVGIEQYGSTLPENEIPIQIKHAVFECALRFISGNMAPDLDRGGSVKSVKVGPIETSYSDNAIGGMKYQAVEMLVSSLIKSKTRNLARS